MNTKIYESTNQVRGDGPQLQCWPRRANTRDSRPRWGLTSAGVVRLGFLPVSCLASTSDTQPCSCDSHCRWHHARTTRLPHVLVGFTRM